MPNTATSHTLEVPGARLHYEVRGSGPVLMMVGLPVDGTAFAPIAALLADEYTVVTYDPRGISRSSIEDSGQDMPPDLVADDVHRVLATVTNAPAHVFGSSGGAITGLALVTRHPRQVRTLIAHEPPLVELLPDAGRIRAAIDDVHHTFRTDGADAAWPKFFALNGVDPGPVPLREQQPPSAEARANGDRMLAHCLLPTTRYRPDLVALAATSTTVVVGLGAASTGQLPHRTAIALADHLGVPPVTFPGDHDGYLGEPQEFAGTLRHVLHQAVR